MKRILKYLSIVFLLGLPTYLVYEENIQQAKNFVDTNWPQALTGGDQHGIYVTFKEAFEGNTVPRGIKNGWIGVGYLALLGFYHKVTMLGGGTTIEKSFIYSGLLYAMLAAFVSVLLMFRVAIDQRPSSNKILVALGCSILWILSFRLSSTLRFVYIPWSHYASAFVGLSFVFCFYESVIRKKTAWIFACAFFGTLFWFARRHEALAVFASVGSLLVLFFIFPLLSGSGRAQKKKAFLTIMITVCLAIFLAIGSIKYFSNNMPLNSHYSQQRESNSYVNEYLKIYPQMIPLRFVQTFFDPNFYSYGANYTVRTIFSGGYETADWSMPMIFQMPILWYFIALVLLTLAVSLFYIRKWTLEKSPALVLFGLGVMSASVLVAGYLSTAVWGGIHLQHGLVREFMLALLLLTTVLGPGLLFFIADLLNMKKLVWIIPAVGILFLSVIWGQEILSRKNFLVFPSKHLNPKAIAEYHCVQANCNVKWSYQTIDNKPIDPPFDYSIVSFNCNEGIPGNPLALGEAGVTRRGTNINFDILDCPSGPQVNVYPLFTGYCGTGQPAVQFYGCASSKVAPNCTITSTQGN